jgi:acetyl-CoA acetyltransferase
VEIPQRKGDPVVFTVDESPQKDIALEKLAKLSPGFKKDGTVTAGKASNLNDGASIVVVASEARILTTLTYALKHREFKKGVASLCLGGGEAVAMAVEMI